MTAYDELAAWAAALPRRLRYTLHAHPHAIERLSQLVDSPGPERYQGIWWALNSIDIISEPLWPLGHWELRRDDEVVHAGTVS